MRRIFTLLALFGLAAFLVGCSEPAPQAPPEQPKVYDDASEAASLKQIEQDATPEGEKE
ncbi:MAG: hypothetical protein ABIG68_03200 [Acidobacteriota bacterium]